MVDVSAIAGVMSSLKVAGDITKAAVGLRDAQALQTKVIELQGVILSAQSSAITAQTDQFSLLERVRDLETKMAQLEAWEAEKQRYKLTDYGGGTFAYELKPEAAGSEPMHRLCATCYQQGHKAILQFDFRTSAGQDKYNCYTCKTPFEFGTRQQRSQRGGVTRSEYY
jgi:hypothetical protein